MFYHKLHVYVVSFLCAVMGLFTSMKTWEMKDWCKSKHQLPILYAGLPYVSGPSSYCVRKTHQRQSEWQSLVIAPRQLWISWPAGGPRPGWLQILMVADGVTFLYNPYLFLFFFVLFLISKFKKKNLWGIRS